MSLRVSVWSDIWGPVILMLCYNSGDTFGKFISNIRFTYNIQSISYLLFSRFLFFYFAIVIVMNPGILKGTIFSMILLLLIGISNGYIMGKMFIRLKFNYV